MEDNSADEAIDKAKKYDDELKARDQYLISGKLPLSMLIKMGIKSLAVDPMLFFIKNLPGPIGFKTRQLWYKNFLGSMGKGSIIEVGVSFSHPRNVFLDSFVFIDQYCQFLCSTGCIKIGKRTHIAPFCVILGQGGVEIGSFVGISPGAKIMSLSDWPGNGKRICGPMVPMSQRGLKEGKITIKNEVNIGSNSVIMPGVTIGEGAVIGANTIISADVEPWTIVLGIPPRVIGKRDPVTEPDPDLL
jgi:acetyltransferase-like isoleucine patch superfamily enzyme